MVQASIFNEFDLFCKKKVKKKKNSNSNSSSLIIEGSKQKLHQDTIKKKIYRDFPGGTVDKNPPASAGDTGSIPGLGRFHLLQSD